MKTVKLPIREIVQGAANNVATKDLSRVLRKTGYRNATTNKIAGDKMALVKAGLLAKGTKPFTIEQATKGLEKKETATYFKSIIAACPVLTRKQLSVLLGVSENSVSAYKAHITMGN